MGDINNDGYPELVGKTDPNYTSATGHGVFAIDRNANILFSGVAVEARSNFAIADVTGDNIPDILFQGATGFSVIQGKGTLSTLAVKSRNTTPNTPIVTDLDQNGTEDLVFLNDDSPAAVYAWDLKVPAHASAEQWTQFGFSSTHNNRYERKVLPAKVTGVVAQVGNAQGRALKAAQIPLQLDESVRSLNVTSGACLRGVG